MRIGSDVLADLPDLTEEDVVQALQYAAEALRERARTSVAVVRARFLVDNKLSPVVVSSLVDAVHDAVHVRD